MVDGMTTTITAKQREALRAALLSPDLIICAGVGSAYAVGQGRACTIAEINLVLTGKLTDDPHPCMSDVIRRWVIRIQDDMPRDIRNSQAWRDAAVGIAGTAADDEIERKRAALLLDWMWDALADKVVIASLPESALPAWRTMLVERTPAAARATYAATYASAVRRSKTATYASAATAATAYAAYAAVYATEVAVYATEAAVYATEATEASAVVRAADAVAHAADAIHATHATYAAYWERRDAPGMLRKLIEVTA